MLKCYALKDTHREIFCKLFADYYEELGCDDNVPHLLEEYVLPDYLAGLLSIDLIDDDGQTAGFIIYQTDGIANEWCMKEGLGNVREIYVAPSRRRCGLGRLMLFNAEMKLRESGVSAAYTLPYEEAIPFFTACGYADSGQYCDELDCNFYVKENLDNTCKHCK